THTPSPRAEWHSDTLRRRSYVRSIDAVGHQAGPDGPSHQLVMRSHEFVIARLFRVADQEVALRRHLGPGLLGRGLVLLGGRPGVAVLLGPCPQTDREPPDPSSDQPLKSSPPVP